VTVDDCNVDTWVGNDALNQDDCCPLYDATIATDHYTAECDPVIPPTCETSTDWTTDGLTDCCDVEIPNNAYWTE